jgi:hypothetical protein
LSEDGKWHPVSSLSKSLSVVEQNYEIHNMEMLVVMCVLEKWRHYLEGAQQPFEPWTDHKNLEYFQTAQKLNQHQAGSPFSPPASTSPSTTNLVAPWANPMLFPDERTMVLARRTTATLPY